VQTSSFGAGPADRQAELDRTERGGATGRDDRRVARGHDRSVEAGGGRNDHRRARRRRGRVVRRPGPRWPARRPRSRSCEIGGGSDRGRGGPDSLRRRRRPERSRDRGAGSSVRDGAAAGRLHLDGEGRLPRGSSAPLRLAGNARSQVVEPRVEPRRSGHRGRSSVRRSRNRTARCVRAGSAGDPPRRGSGRDREDPSRRRRRRRRPPGGALRPGSSASR
jgi:hypothetical protein